jgi:hypothetical protein
MEQLFDLLDFFATGAGLLIIGASAALIVLAWDWRVSLVGLFLIQVGIAALGVALHSVSAQWAALQIIVMLLCLLILALSAQQVHEARALHQAGNWLVRFMALVLLVLAWRVIDVMVPLPELGSSTTALVGWLVLCTLLILGLSDSPFFTAVAFLLWMIPAQTLLAVLIPSSNLFAVIGGVELLIALACSYLILLDRAPGLDRKFVVTDIVFPYQEEASPWAEPVDEDEPVDAVPRPGFVEGLFAALQGKPTAEGKGTNSRGQAPASSSLNPPIVPGRTRQ